MDQRLFGLFSCNCGNDWPSAYAWEGKYQECLSCGKQVYASSLRPLERGKGGPHQKPHQEHLCEKCQELGHSCTTYSPSIRGLDSQDEVNDEDSDDESIISIGSSTLSSGTEDSDTEEEADEMLDREMKKLSI